LTSQTATTIWRRRQLERIERNEVVHTKETFGENALGRQPTFRDVLASPVIVSLR
jgi:hypothetical protein